MSKTKICRGCYQPFSARRDAKTCSPRCRKRVQRTRDLLSKETLPARRRVPAIAAWLIILLAFSLSLFGGRILAMSQGYPTADKTLRPGMAVSLAADNIDGHLAVQAAPQADADKVIGIAVNLSDDITANAPAGSQVFVESSGQAKAYVSDLGGTVKRGDLLTLSPVTGVLMRTTDTTVSTVGKALADFSAADSQALSAKDAAGRAVSAHAEILSINIVLQPPSSTAKNYGWLENLGISLTGRRINGLRVLAAMAIFASLLVVEGEIIYGTITTAITALGRNPLAKATIGRQALRSVGLGGLVLVIGIGAIGVLLWL